jgi:hypothetical protein
LPDRCPETEEAPAMTFQSARGYLLLETGPAYTAVRAPIFWELLIQWQSKAEWQDRPPDAGRWEIEARQDVDALKGYRHTVIVLGRYTLTYWPWEVVRKLRLLNRKATP